LLWYCPPRPGWLLSDWATVLTFAGNGVGPAIFPLVVGLLAGFVAYGRWRLAPHRERSDFTIALNEEET